MARKFLRNCSVRGLEISWNQIRQAWKVVSTPWCLEPKSESSSLRLPKLQVPFERSKWEASPNRGEKKLNSPPSILLGITCFCFIFPEVLHSGDTFATLKATGFTQRWHEKKLSPCQHATTRTVLPLSLPLDRVFWQWLVLDLPKIIEYTNNMNPPIQPFDSKKLMNNKTLTHPMKLRLTSLLSLLIAARPSRYWGLLLQNNTSQKTCSKQAFGEIMTLYFWPAARK